MAILTFAAPVSGLRGKVGGLIYSANKAGPFVKTWGKGSNPRTAPQTQQRANLVQFAQNWKNLTAAQRTDWDTYAALPAQDKTNSLGETFSISGFAWYVALSNNLKRAGAAAIDSAPLLGTPATPIIQDARLVDDGFAGDSRIRLTAGSPTLTAEHIVTGVVLNSEGRATATINRTWLNTEVPNVGRAVFFQDEINAKFGTIQTTQFGFFEIQIQNAEGRQGAPDAIIQQAEA